MDTVRKFLHKCNIDGRALYGESMAAHTSFRIGGPADAFVLPSSGSELARLLEAVSAEGLPCTVIGGGANLLVADSGLRGIVASTSLMRGISMLPQADGSVLVRADAGVPVTELVRFALDNALAGLEFAAGLPGSVGGAAYMNARCYEREFADVMSEVDWIRPVGAAPGVGNARPAAEAAGSLAVQASSWAYKRTPFMAGGTLCGAIITGAEFHLTPGDGQALKARAAELEADRRAKGHFDYPCAGSMFKNDRAFGRPTGKILDELGFRGRRIGDAMVSPKHANIFVNAGKASATDMLALVSQAQDEAYKAFGFKLEPEVVFLG